ncbi:hypothetical protein NKI20_07380 [Mesorhizobium sp. M0830]
MRNNVTKVTNLAGPEWFLELNALDQLPVIQDDGPNPARRAGDPDLFGLKYDPSRTWQPRGDRALLGEIS